jgi:tetratricopeptide (TPR) repeat protein
MCPLVGKTVSHYKILSKLGEGGMGAVYLAEDEQLARNVAIKFLPVDAPLDSTTLSRFRREAKSAARLKHPNIVTIHEFGEHEGMPYLVMEHVDGRTLAEALEAGRLPVTTAVDIAVQVCDGLVAAHEAGITHRDIKPANVVIDRSGRARILDFGLAKLEDATALTEEGTTVGTMAYMSPEQLGGRTVDTRTDIFSLGVVLYEMLTGRRPFEAERAAAVSYKIVHEAHDPLPAGLEPFGGVISRALAKDPASRFQSAVEFGNALRSVSGHSATVAAGKRRRWKAVAAIVGGVAVVVAVVLITKPFKLEMTRPDGTAVENKLAVVYFDNMIDPSDPKHYGEMMAELLITGLSESEDVSIVSSQRLYDLLKQLGKQGEKKIDRTTATEVATRAHARWMMLGRILQTEPNFVITSQIVDVATGDVAASQRTLGERGESLFSLVDRITGQTLDDLTASDVAAVVRPVQEISTSSEDAYRYYLEGIEYRRKHYFPEARESFHQALAFDSTFAMAAFHLGMLAGGVETRRYLQQALRHADRASAREQLYLKAAEAFANFDWPAHNAAFKAVLQKYPDDKFALERLATTSSSTIQERIEYGSRLVELDPTDKEAWNNLAYAYARLGDAENAFRAVDEYIALVPEEPSPYKVRGDLDARFGRLDEAIASYKKAIEIKPDFYSSVSKLGDMYANNGDFAKAQGEYRRILESPDARTRRMGRTKLIGLLEQRGRYTEALDAFEAGEEVERIEGLADAVQIEMWRLVLKARIVRYVTGKGSASARSEIVHYLKQRDPATFWEWIFACETMIELGMAEEASGYLEPLRVQADNLPPYERLLYDVEEGRVASARGEYDTAIATYDTLWSRVATDAHPTTRAGFQLWLAEACFKAKRWNDVIRVVERRLNGYPYEGIRDARFHYYLGVAYQEVSRNDEAIEQLETLLAIWEDADPGLEGLVDAQNRLDILKRAD